MHLETLRRYFDTSPAIRLLRSPHAPFIVNFLYQQFKRTGRIAIPYSDLHAALVAYREHIHETDPDVLRDKSDTYLINWCSGETRWLQRTLMADRTEPVYQLTRHTEDVIGYLERVSEQDLGFVGTESRLRAVINMLSDLVSKSSDDPQIRLAQLQQEKSRLEAEIEQITSGGLVDRYHPARIREQFATAVHWLKELQGDFRAVEEKFKEITQQVQHWQAEGKRTRGRILEFALDAEDVLKKQDQGVSFYEFVRFILSPQEQERLRSMIGALGRIRELSDQAEGLEAVRRMVPLLLAEAEQVMRTNQRLSATLRRLLDLQAARERQRIARLLQELRALAVARADDPPQSSVYLELENTIDIASPWSRTFWSAPPQFDHIDLTEHVADDQRRRDAFRRLVELQRIDWRRLRGHVHEAVAQQGSATLGRILEHHPPETGVVEVLGYLQIASDDGHLINPDMEEEIKFPDRRVGHRGMSLTLPLVTFVAGR